MAGTSLRFFSVVSTIGAPIDVTAQELRVEAFFPADDQNEGPLDVARSQRAGVLA